jgi:hypothetical protein
MSQTFIGVYPIPDIEDDKLQDLASRIRIVKTSNRKPTEEVMTVSGPDFTDKIVKKLEVGHGNYSDMYERKTAMAHGHTKLFYQTAPSDLRKVSCIWDAEPTEEDTSHLEEFAVIHTYHTFGAPVFFKPSFAEVLAQIPDRYLDKVVAVEICTQKDDYFVSYQPLDSEDPTTTLHKAYTILYRNKLDNPIASKRWG